MTVGKNFPQLPLAVGNRGKIGGFLIPEAPALPPLTPGMSSQSTFQGLGT